MTDIKKLVSEMTLEEKASLLGGDDFWHTKAVERLGIPRFMMSDGPHGLRKQDQKADHLGINDSIKAVCFPAACATASSFDRDLIRHMGDTIGNECQAEDLSVVLGPAVNIKRSPLCGRNFEYFSEDPYLAGEMAAAYINGVQSHHVGTSIKHFAANNQETGRMNVSAEVSERTLREIYFPAFETAVKKAQPKTVMCSYNKINGTYSADNEWLLTKVLRDDWGFQGFVMTDWGAVDDRVQGIRAGLELEMPGNTAGNDAQIVQAVKDGKLDEALVDRSVERILEVLYDYYDNREPEAVFDRAKDHDIAGQVEEECAVLLENNGVLPLKAGQKVVYIGEFAEKPRYQGGGSSHINSTKVVSALDAAKESGRDVTYVKGFPADKDETDEEEIARAVEAAKTADVAVVFAGLPDVIESEGYDRQDMNLPVCQNRLIEEVLKVQKNTVIVLHNGSPVVAPWADQAAAILEMYLGGEAVGTAEDQLLYGEANPSGHLAETFPLKLEDNPSYLNFPGDGKKVHYDEGVYVGYRYYDSKKMPVRWAFGHGLSYTTFRIDNIRLTVNGTGEAVRNEDNFSGTAGDAKGHAAVGNTSEKMKDQAAAGDYTSERTNGSAAADSGESRQVVMVDGTTVVVSVDVTNTGDRAGKEVVQLYVHDANGTAGRPVKELKGFEKVALEPGETKTVTMTIDARALSYWNGELGDWFAPSGKYEILVGDASDNIAATAELSFTTSKLLPLTIAGDTTMGELLKDPRTAPVIMKMAEERHGSAPVDMSSESSDAGMGAGAQQMANAMMMYMPLKSLVSFGIMNQDQLNGLMAMLNGLVK